MTPGQKMQLRLKGRKAEVDHLYNRLELCLANGASDQEIESIAAQLKQYRVYLTRVPVLAGQASA